MRTTLTIASVLLWAATIPAAAQDFRGDCRAYTASDACKASGWCQWRQPKPVTTPDGTTVAPKATCAFRKGFKAAWAERQTK